MVCTDTSHPTSLVPILGRKKNNNDDSSDIAAVTKRDTDLPDDFSIFGGSSITSSTSGGNHFDYEEGDDDVNIELGETGASSRALKLVDALSLASTLSSEKQSKKREGMLRLMFTAITTCATGTSGRDILDNYWTLVYHACLHSMAGKGNAKPSEQYAACRVIEACSVILGGDRDDVVVSVDESLRKVVNATGRSTQVRVAALRCLSMMHFICGTNCLEDDMDCASVMELCQKIGGETRYRGDNTPSLLRATALDCWSLLSTTFHDSQLASGDDSSGDLGRGLRLLPILALCLDSPDAALRRSAGEAVSLIHECRLRMGLEEDEAVNTTERKFRRGSWNGTEWEVLMDDLKQRISDLAVESSHHMSKQAKKDQRSTFRDYMRTIVDDEFPDKVVNWKGGKLRLNSWKEIIQLNFVRHCLQGGFHTQLITNETLHIIFGATLDVGTSTLSQNEKIMFLSKTSDAAKAADKEMMKQRRIRTNKKNHFLTADGDDI